MTAAHAWTATVYHNGERVTIVREVLSRQRDDRNA